MLITEQGRVSLTVEVQEDASKSVPRNKFPKAQELWGSFVSLDEIIQIMQHPGFRVVNVLPEDTFNQDVFDDGDLPHRKIIDYRGNRVPILHDGYPYNVAVKINDRYILGQVAPLGPNSNEYLALNVDGKNKALLIRHVSVQSTKRA